MSPTFTILAVAAVFGLTLGLSAVPRLAMIADHESRYQQALFEVESQLHSLRGNQDVLLSDLADRNAWITQLGSTDPNPEVHAVHCTLGRLGHADTQGSDTLRANRERLLKAVNQMNLDVENNDSMLASAPLIDGNI